jgi:hypothetical protein
MIHAKWIACQTALAFCAILANSTRNDEPRNCLIASLIIGGFWIFPLTAAQRVNRVARPTEYRGGFGSWMLQTSACAALLLFILPPSPIWKIIVSCAVMFSIVLLLFSTKREARKRSVPTVAE